MPDSAAEMSVGGGDAPPRAAAADDVTEHPQQQAHVVGGGCSTGGGEMGGILELCRLAHVLKHLPRTGWLRAGVAGRCESVAGHSWRVALLALLVDGGPALDRDRCVRMALVHDLAESLVGDLTPHCGVAEAEKSRREAKAMEHIARLLPGGKGEELAALWREYEAQASPEARLVKQLDRFDLLAQASEYEREGRAPAGRLDEFFRAAELIRDPPVLGWTRQLLQRRQPPVDPAPLD